MKRIAVYCGSQRGARPEYAAAAAALGALLGREKIELVYGGGMVGLMGVLADAVLQHGGHVIGVIPEKLVIKEVVHEQLPDLRVVNSMHITRESSWRSPASPTSASAIPCRAR